MRRNEVILLYHTAHDYYNYIYLNNNYIIKKVANHTVSHQLHNYITIQVTYTIIVLLSIMFTVLSRRHRWYSPVLP